MNNADTIYIDVEDDISTIIEKVEESAKPAAKLVLPKRSAVLQSTVNMRLLKQSAEKAGKEIVLVTSDDAVLPLASAIGLATAKNLQDEASVPVSETPPTNSADEPYTTAKPVGQDESVKSVEPKKVRASSKVAAGTLADAQEKKDPETVELDDEEPATDEAQGSATKKSAPLAGVPKLSVPNFDRFRKWLLFGGSALILLITFLILAIKVLPKATIAIQTTSTPVQLNMNVTASGGAKKLDETNSIIPSSVQTYKQTASKQITATGKQDIGSKATGTVYIKNCYDTSTHSVPSGTTFSANGNNYISTSSITVPAGTGTFGGGCTSSSVPDDVIASLAGDTYNQPATSYTTSDPTISAHMDPSVGFSITGSAMSGGTSNVVTVVSQQDVNKAVAALTADPANTDQSKVTDQFKSQLDSQGYYLIDSTLKVSKPAGSSSPAVGQQASSATVTITTTYSVMALKKDDLTKLVSDYAKKQIDATKQTVDTTNILTKVTVDVASQSSPTDASLTIGGSVTAMPLIDTNTVKTNAMGKKKGDIENELSGWPGVKSVNVKLSPFWVSVVPSKPGKVVVNIQALTGSAQ